MFHLKPYTFPISEELPYTPTYSLEESIGEYMHTQLIQLREKYMAVASQENDKFTAGCDAVAKKIDEDLEATYYRAYESSLIANTLIPKPMNDLIKVIDAMEEKSPMMKMKQDYEALKARYLETVNSAEEYSATAIFKVNQSQNATAEIKKFLMHMANYIEKKKFDLESIQQFEGNELFKLVDGFMHYLFVANRQKLVAFIAKNENPSLSDVLESAYNYLLKCKGDIDLVKSGLRNDQKRVKNIFFDERQLRYDLMRGAKAENIEAAFPRYLSCAQEEGNCVLRVYEESRGYFANLNTAIQNIEKEMPFMATMGNKVKLFKALLDRVKAYHKIVKFYEGSIEKMKYNIDGLEKAIHQLKKSCAL